MKRKSKIKKPKKKRNKSTKMKKYFKHQHNQYQKYIQFINSNGLQFWCPQFNPSSLVQHPKLDLKIYDSKIRHKMNIEPMPPKKEKKEDNYSVLKYTFIPTQNQIHDLSLLFDSYMEMYNLTVQFLKQGLTFEFKIMPYSYYTVRKTLDSLKRDIIDRYNRIHNYKIRVHILDCAIQQATANLKSALTNLRRKRIKHFRMRYWRKNKSILEVHIPKDTPILNLLGSLNFVSNRYNDNPPDLKLDAIIQYDKKEDKYYIFLRKKIIPSYQQSSKSKIISIDPGIRSFHTCLTDQEVLKFGSQINSYISKRVEMIYKINKMKGNRMKKKKRNELIRRLRRNIRNKVDELHWKTIKYLTDNYQIILIGDMSVKGITRKGSGLKSRVKKMALSLRFNEYRQRLNYKCQVRNRKLYTVNESYTSKMCSMCGNLNSKLGGSKIFECPSCEIQMDRDVNGCRGIYIKSGYATK